MGGRTNTRNGAGTGVEVDKAHGKVPPGEKMRKPRCEAGWRNGKWRRRSGSGRDGDGHGSPDIGVEDGWVRHWSEGGKSSCRSWKPFSEIGVWDS